MHWGIRNMAASNLIALSAQQNAKLTTLDTKLCMLLWMVPVAAAIIGIQFRIWG